MNLLPEIFNLLNKNCNYAVLRNYEQLPHTPSRDIDIIIKRGDFNKVKTQLADIATKCGFSLFQYYNGSEMNSLVFSSVKNGVISFVSFDFLFSIYVRDIILMTASECLSDREFNGHIYHVRADKEFLSKYLYNKLLNEPYPAKYAAIKEKALRCYGDDVDNTLLRILGKKSSESSKTSFSSVARKMWSKHFVRQLSASSRYLWRTLCNMVNPAGVSFGFTGPDGIGKTTIIDNIIDQCKQLYKTVPLYHFRPSIFGNLGDVAQSAGLKKDVDRNYNDPHRGKKTGVISSLLRLCYYSSDYITGFFIKVWPSLFKREVVIFDRYFTDIICDSRRSRIYLPPKFLNLWRKLFIPSLDYNILLTASSETILARKRELDEAGINAINERIDYLAPKKGYIKVLNESTPDAAVTEILNHIFNEQHKKNLKRLK